MSESTDAVLAYWAEHRQQLRQCESQRATLTNFLLVITAGLSGLIIQQRFADTTLTLSALITLTGLYGALATAKYHERAHYHLLQARALTNTLKAMNVLADDPHLAQYRETHYAAYPRLSRIRLHWLWTGLHLTIAVFGAVLALIALIR